MIQASLWEQLMILFKILKSNPYVIVLSIASLVSFLILLLADKFKNKKITKIICSLVYVITFFILFYFYHEEIFNLLDYLINNIFIFLFFPNLAVYMLVILTINIIVIKSTFSKKESKSVKIINSLFFVIFNIIFYLIIDNIINHKINVYEQLSIYTNNNLLVLVELSMKLFITWLIILLINKIVIKINNYVLIRKNSNKNLVLDVAVNQDELVNANEIVEITPKVKPIPEYNVYNDYLDIVPIKKEKTIILPLEETVFKNNYEEEFQVENNIETTNQLLKSEYVSNNYLNLENDKELENNLLNTPTINQVLPKNDEILNQIKSQTLSLDELLNEVWENSEKKLTTIKIEPEYEFPKSKASSISLGSYDEIFKEIKIDNQEELDNLFKEESNYLSNIMLDINELKTKQDDPNQIRKIYNSIKLNENNLTLKDYNYLINRLLDIKK